jgi:hypothetical protein
LFAVAEEDQENQTMAHKFSKPKYRKAIAITIYLQIILWGALIGIVVSLSTIGIAAIDIVLRPAAILLFVSVGLISRSSMFLLTAAVLPLSHLSYFSHFRRPPAEIKSIQRKRLSARQETRLYSNASNDSFGVGLADYDWMEFDCCCPPTYMSPSWYLGCLLASGRTLRCTTIRNCYFNDSSVSIASKASD